MQFEEYRATAEFLFKTEVSQLHAKSNSQMEKYESEMKLIIRQKDFHFDSMMVSKDSKIMNLIEGTDFQGMLLTFALLLLLCFNLLFAQRFMCSTRLKWSK